MCCIAIGRKNTLLIEEKKMCDLEELKKRTLILTQTDPQTDMMFRTWIDNKMNADIIFSPKPKILRAIRRMWTD